MVLDSLSGADRAQLHELYARSVMLLEFGRVNHWAELFATDAVIRSVRGDGTSEFKGKAELLNLGRQIITGEFDIVFGALDSPSRCRHHLSNLCLFKEGSYGVAGYAHVLAISCAAEPRLLRSGTYFDRLHRCASGCWHFQSRTFTADAAAAMQVGQAYTDALAKLAGHS